MRYREEVVDFQSIPRTTHEQERLLTPHYMVVDSTEKANESNREQASVKSTLSKEDCPLSSRDLK